VRQDEDPAPVPDPNVPLNNVPVNDVMNVTLDLNINTNSKLMGTSFSIQNVRSLNISTKNEITVQKLLGVCKLGTDFIFLSDMRLNSSKQVSAVHDLDKKLFLKGYKLYHNSGTSLRGVGIMVSKKYSESGFSVLEEIKSDDNNILCMHVEINGQKILLVSVYGPNKDTEINFYENLKIIIRPFKCPCIIGGDWNATFDISDVNQNLDILNMQNIPSLRRSTKIHEV